MPRIFTPNCCGPVALAGALERRSARPPATPWCFRSRRPTQGAGAPPVAEQLDSLRPHLARAALLSGRLGLDRAKSTVTTLEAIGLPAAALTPDGRRGFGNAGYLASEPRISIGAGNPVQLASAPAQALLMEAVSNAAIASGRIGKSIPVRASRNRTRLRRTRRAAAGRRPSMSLQARSRLSSRRRSHGAQAPRRHCCRRCST